MPKVEAAEVDVGHPGERVDLFVIVLGETCRRSSLPCRRSRTGGLGSAAVFGEHLNTSTAWLGCGGPTAFLLIINPLVGTPDRGRSACWPCSCRGRLPP